MTREQGKNTHTHIYIIYIIYIYMYMYTYFHRSSIDVAVVVVQGSYDVDILILSLAVLEISRTFSLERFRWSRQLHFLMVGAEVKKRYCKCRIFVMLQPHIPEHRATLPNYIAFEGPHPVSDVHVFSWVCLKIGYIPNYSHLKTG